MSVPMATLYSIGVRKFMRLGKIIIGEAENPEKSRQDNQIIQR